MYIQASLETSLAPESSQVLSNHNTPCYYVASYWFCSVDKLKKITIHYPSLLKWARLGVRFHADSVLIGNFKNDIDNLADLEKQEKNFV